MSGMHATNKYICIHGHFYQPPRENAWLEVIETQDTAAPFHDWNERINFECYAPNTAARILDERQFIRKIVNNYTRISFNFGPTLLSWLETEDPSTYQSILDADKISQLRYGGKGAALAQAHSHLILPLANRRDKETQIVWGIRDFHHRFGRDPEGMWLAETAVDIETLEVLAENNIRFTILAPRQAAAIRRLGAEEWTQVDGETVDTRRPYLCKLPSGKSIALFFYHGPLSQAVAFDGLLNNGKRFADRILSAFDDNDSPQLVHIATDGETYGHHHRYGEMALADCLNYIEENHLATVVHYGTWLDRFPPEYEAAIHENSSWSCAHGVERWRSNCGCHTGAGPGWTQEWRKPLRETLNWLRDELVPIFEKEGGKLLKDVWAARNEYIRVMLNRQVSARRSFVEQHAKRELDKKEITQALRLLEMQRQAMFMFTSCGWFFDEISGIETLQIMQYANRAMHYAWQVTKRDLHPEFLRRLEMAPSNVFPNGAEVYRQKVAPSEVLLEQVGMHYAVASLFEEEPEQIQFYNFIAESDFFERRTAGIQRLAIGSATVQSRTTLSEKRFFFAALYLGQQNIIGNIALNMSPEDFERMRVRLFDAFQATNLASVIGVMQEYFGPEKYTIWRLFRDEMRKVLEDITRKSYAQVDTAFRNFYEDNYQLMSGMLHMDFPIPSAFRNAVQFVVNRDLHRLFENGGGSLDVRDLRRLAGEFVKWEIKLSQENTFKLISSERIYAELLKLDRSELSLPQLNRLIEAIEILYGMDIKPNIWKIQNLYFSMLKGFKNGEWVFASGEWEEAFLKLGNLLNVRV